MRGNGYKQTGSQGNSPECSDICIFMRSFSLKPYNTAQYE